MMQVNSKANIATLITMLFRCAILSVRQCLSKRKMKGMDTKELEDKVIIDNDEGQYLGQVNI
jgi:hypothetical protein